jgi:hypothetical protein
MQFGPFPDDRFHDCIASSLSFSPAFVVVYSTVERPGNHSCSCGISGSPASVETQTWNITKRHASDSARQQGQVASHGSVSRARHPQINVLPSDLKLSDVIANNTRFHEKVNSFGNLAECSSKQSQIILRECIGGSPPIQLRFRPMSNPPKASHVYAQHNPYGFVHKTDCVFLKVTNNPSSTLNVLSDGGNNIRIPLLLAFCIECMYQDID